MTLSVVGEQTRILQSDWYKELTQEQLAAYIRYQFIYLNENAIDWDSSAHSRVRHVWDGGKSRDGRAYSSTWRECIRAIERAESSTLAAIYPGMWVHAHFSPAAEAKLTNSSALPDIRPQTLHSARSPAIYSKYINIGPQLIAHKYELAADTLKLRMQSVSKLNISDADKIAYALCDETYVTASPFFRHAFAVRYNCDDALELYLWEAAIQYEANQPLYDAVMRATENSWWLTEALQAAVFDIRMHWRQYCG